MVNDRRSTNNDHCLNVWNGHIAVDVHNEGEAKDVRKGEEVGEGEGGSEDKGLTVCLILRHKHVLRKAKVKA